MRVLVMGGGVVGVTTAYELLQDGHEVVLLEKNEGVGLETSWGNAGMIAPGHSFVWSSPQAPIILLKSLFKKNQALRFRPSLDLRLWTWSARFLAECTEHKARVSTIRKHQLATYSQHVLHRTLARDPIEYDRSTKGILYCHRDEESLKRGVEHMQLLADHGQEIRVLDREGVFSLDPSLQGSRARIAGAIYCPSDETGDCNKFTTGLAKICEERGAEFHPGTEVTGIEVGNGRVTAVRTKNKTFKADIYVMALGNGSAPLARTIGVELPIYPIKGYSLTVPVGNHKRPPNIAAVDENALVAISRFGDRLRLTATAEFAGYNKSHKPADFALMRSVAEELYPDGADYERGQMWAGLRPMTPTNLPIFGRKKHENLFYNTGHGHIGWTMSHGSARITADLIAGRTPEIPLAA